MEAASNNMHSSNHHHHHHCHLHHHLAKPEHCTKDQQARSSVNFTLHTVKAKISFNVTGEEGYI